MPDRSIWVCPSRYRRLSTASVASLLRQNSEPAIADNALFPRLSCASQVYICRKTFGYLLSTFAVRDVFGSHSESNHFAARSLNLGFGWVDRRGDSGLGGGLVAWGCGCGSCRFRLAAFHSAAHIRSHFSSC